MTPAQPVRPGTFHLYGIEIPRQTARDALDGTTVFEAATNLPVRRWRTQLDAAIQRHPAGKRLNGAA